MPRPNLLILLGLSGVGKTHVGKALADQNWLQGDLDTWGVDQNPEAELGVRAEQFRQSGVFQPLADSMTGRTVDGGKAGFVLGFGSGFTLPRESIEVANDSLRVRYLTGSPEHCIAAFLAREHETGRGLPREWWIANNLPVAVRGEVLLSYLDRPSMAPCCVRAFNRDGTHRNVSEVIDDLLR